MLTSLEFRAVHAVGKCFPRRRIVSGEPSSRDLCVYPNVANRVVRPDWTYHLIQLVRGQLGTIALSNGLIALWSRFVAATQRKQ